MTQEAQDKTRYARLRDLVADLAGADLADARTLSALQKRAQEFLVESSNAAARNEGAAAWRKREVEKHDAELVPLLRKMRQEERLSMREIADRLHGMRIWSPRGTFWHPSSIRMVMRRNGIE